MTRIALALGAGGARGYAHIGAVQVLRERGFEISVVAGTSMGALIGGLVAAGREDRFAEWAAGLSQRDIWRLLDWTASGGGFFRIDKVIGTVSEILDGALIEDLPIPFTAVATDLTAKREVWFQRGPVDTAIRASIAIPTVITPITLDGHLIVDGGILNPLPIDPTMSVRTDLTVAVDLYGRPRVQEQRTPEKASSEGLAGGFMRTLSDLFGGFGGRGGDEAVEGERGEKALPPSPPGDTGGPPVVGESAAGSRAAGGTLTPGGPVPVPAAAAQAAPKALRIIDLMNQSLDTTAALLTRYRLASNPPDVMVQIPSDACAMMDYHRAKDMIALGRELTELALSRAGL